MAQGCAATLKTRRAEAAKHPNALEKSPQLCLDLKGYELAPPVQSLRPMVLTFNAEDFVANVKRGDFDGRLISELRKLSMDQLEEVVEQIMSERSMMNRGLQKSHSLS
jgi:hypothetical protein